MHSCRDDGAPSIKGLYLVAHHGGRNSTGSPVAIGESSVILTTLFIPIETPTKGTGGCSRMTVSSGSTRLCPRRRTWCCSPPTAVGERSFHLDGTPLCTRLCTPLSSSRLKHRDKGAGKGGGGIKMLGGVWPTRRLVVSGVGDRQRLMGERNTAEEHRNGGKTKATARIAVKCVFVHCVCLVCLRVSVC